MEETENKVVTKDPPSVDFSLQLSLDKNSEHVESSAFEWLKIIAKEVHGGKQDSLGALIVVGEFEKFGPRVQGMLQMKPKQNPIESMKMIDSEDSGTHIKDFSEPPYDGAIVVNSTGQIVGAGIYLVIDNPTLDTPEDCGTRHKAAASFSLRNDVIGVLTLSEETNIVRVWKDGRVSKVYRIEDEENKIKTKE